MQQITPFLWFDNQAEEAARFYVSIFKNSKIGDVTRYGEAGPGPPNGVMTMRGKSVLGRSEETRTMRFMMLMIPKGYQTAAPGAMPDAKAVAAMMKYNESLQRAGVLLALDGLHPPSMGARVSFSGGKPKVSDGPFAEAKEVLGGYWMIQVRSKEEAVEWASRCPASDDEMIEVRQVQEFSDFPADVQQAAAEFSEMQAQSGQRRGAAKA